MREAKPPRPTGDASRSEISYCKVDRPICGASQAPSSRARAPCFHVTFRSTGREGGLLLLSSGRHRARGLTTQHTLWVFVKCVHSMQTREEAKSRLELRIFWVAGADEMLTRLQKRTRRAHCMPTVNSKPQAKFEIPSVLGLLD